VSGGIGGRGKVKRPRARGKAGEDSMVDERGVGTCNSIDLDRTVRVPDGDDLRELAGSDDTCPELASDFLCDRGVCCCLDNSGNFVKCEINLDVSIA
jgi:hypothetical protein